MSDTTMSTSDPLSSGSRPVDEMTPAVAGTTDAPRPFRKKPVVIEAMQLPAEDAEVGPEYNDALHAFLGNAVWESERHGALVIHTLEGAMQANPGDWIIRGVKGEFYPCKPDIFAATYEPAAAARPLSGGSDDETRTPDVVKDAWGDVEQIAIDAGVEPRAWMAAVARFWRVANLASEPVASHHQGPLSGGSDDETREPELLPCPFCGGEAFEETIIDKNEGVAYTPWYQAVCWSCDFWLPGSRNYDEAVAQWNRRAPARSLSDEERAIQARRELEDSEVERARLEADKAELREDAERWRFVHPLLGELIHSRHYADVNGPELYLRFGNTELRCGASYGIDMATRAIDVARLTSTEPPDADPDGFSDDSDGYARSEQEDI